MLPRRSAVVGLTLLALSLSGDASAAYRRRHQRCCCAARLPVWSLVIDSPCLISDIRGKTMAAVRCVAASRS
jgi:hypothetical protein